MAEEDEIDVLGDFTLDNFLTKNESSIYSTTSLVSQNTELLNCDYTIHPQWLLDKPSGNPDNWYDTDLSAGLLEKTQTENEALGHVSTENCITDESGWTEKEKNLLERGIEIFGKSNIRLSQFIGSKTAAEIKYYLKNFYVDSQSTYKNFNSGVIEETDGTNLVSDILNDTQIPASIEEVIAAVSSAKPTVQRLRKKSNSFNSVHSRYIPSGQSLLKSNYIKSHMQPVTPLKNKRMESYLRQGRNKSVKFKFKTKLKLPAKDSKDQAKPKMLKIASGQNKKTEYSKIEITTGKGLAVPICEGEEIVKIKKVDNDSDLDIEIDVEDSIEENERIPQNPHENTQLVPKKGLTENPQKKSKLECAKDHSEDSIDFKLNHLFDLSSYSEATIEELISLENPQQEVILDGNRVTELEKIIHYEFFEGRTAKTPQRYLTIRNYIIKSWNSQKPYYITKTSIRSGLRNCGDVNCIGRIHYFLEQIGAINFGCAQLQYVRPLYDMVKTFVTVKDKSVKNTQTEVKPSNELGSRPRNKKKFANDGEGGCTLTHDEKGHVINTMVINEEPLVKQRSYVKKPTIRLIYCRPFCEEKPQPYTVSINLSTLLIMDFHAHTSLTEVMGLVGGFWIPENRTLIISHYESCVNVASSATHCDMCPISQAKAADIIHNKELDILGWFHSHPTFAPEPSHQDLETQQSVQMWIGHNKPCVGIILSPFSLNGALLASPYRCMIVDRKLNFEDQFVPYKFKVELISDGFVIKEFLKEILKVCRTTIGNVAEAKVEFDKPYFQDSNISYLEKYITSVRMHLAKCGTFSKMECDTIIQGIVDTCSNEKTI